MSALKEPLLGSEIPAMDRSSNASDLSHDTNRATSEKKKDSMIRFRRTSNLTKVASADSQKFENELLAGRLYAINAPKIVLETITARTTLIIIVITYAIFILGFSVDTYTTYEGFTSSNYDIAAYSCTPQTYFQSDTWGCSHGYNWNSTVANLNNVLSVKLSVQQNNLSYVYADMTLNNSFTITYNVNMWACYESSGCGNNFRGDDSYTSNPNVWQKVLFLNDQSLEIDLKSDVRSNDGGSISSILITNTFQNQESIPTNGLVKSYFLQVEYTKDPYNLYSGMNKEAQPYLFYTFDVLTRLQQAAQDALTIVLLVFTLGLFGYYISVLKEQKKILTEQKWLVYYFLLLICFQNPVYCVIVWFNPAPDPSAAYASYFFTDFAQAGLFILWLLFADSVHRKTKNRLYFYGPKVAIGFLIFLTSLIILTFQFPGLSESDRRDALAAVANWSHTLQVEFIVFTLMYLSLIWIWTIAWFIRLYLTSRHLKRLPYMTTRYIQLSYRFFSLQATLVTIYYVFQYAFVIYFISSRVSSAYDATSITDNINTLFRQQTQLFGKTLFLTVYAMILTFLFLPANLLDRTGIKTALAATYVITEEEMKKIRKQRKESLQAMKRNFLNQVTLMNQIVNAKVDVFCVDIALKLRNAAYQAYYDLPTLNTVSGYEGATADLESVGFSLIKHFYLEEHEVICYILREKLPPHRLIVAFRGTASKKQMEDNLNYTKTKLEFDNTGLLTIDKYDGLNFKETDDTRFELESVSDDEDNEDLESSLSLTGDIEQGVGGEAGIEYRRSLSDSLIRHTGGHAGDGPRATETGKPVNIRDAVVNIGDNVAKVITGAVDVTGQGIKGVVGATTGLMTTAAKNTPGLKTFVGLYVHSGFYNAYLSVRPFIHEVLRIELKKNPTTVYFTGHSLGGALATLAAFDVSLNTIPRVNAYLKHQEKLKLVEFRRSLLLNEPPAAVAQSFNFNFFSRPTLFQSPSRPSPPAPSVPSPSTETGRGDHHSVDDDDDLAPSKLTLHHPNSAPAATTTSPTESELLQRSSSLRVRSNSLQRGETEPVFVKRIKAVMYNFGSPRVGNYGFKQAYDRLVPDSFRVVVDGDVVAGLPPNYDHIGTEILVDNLGAGSIIIDPSFVERWLRTQTKSSVAVHSLIYYRKGLLGLKVAADYLKLFAKDLEGQRFDPVQLVVQLRNEHKIEKLVEGREHLVDTLNTMTLEDRSSNATTTTVEGGAPAPVSEAEAREGREQRGESNFSESSVTSVSDRHPRTSDDITFDQHQNKIAMQPMRDPSSQQLSEEEEEEEETEGSSKKKKNKVVLTNHAPFTSGNREESLPISMIDVTLPDSNQSPRLPVPTTDSIEPEPVVATSPSTSRKINPVSISGPKSTLSGTTAFRSPASSTTSASEHAQRLQEEENLRALEQAHYAHDERTMHEFLSQIHGIKKYDSVGDWLSKNNPIKRLQLRRKSDKTSGGEIGEGESGHSHREKRSSSRFGPSSRSRSRSGRSDSNRSGGLQGSSRDEEADEEVAGTRSPFQHDLIEDR